MTENVFFKSINLTSGFGVLGLQWAIENRSSPFDGPRNSW